MAGNLFTSWVHGSTMQVEYPGRLTNVRHTGPFVRIEGAEGQNTWVHFPVPTPTVSNGTKVKAEAALVSFRTQQFAAVKEVIVYDGEKRIAEHMDIDLKGNHLDGRFEIPGTPEMEKGLNIVVGVTFDYGSPTIRSMQIEIVGAGIEFQG